MPPKKQVAQPAKKKPAVDATFGMKNKKGKKAQDLQKQYQASSQGSKADREKAEAAARRKAEKQAQWEKEQETALLFRKVEEKQKPQQIPIGVNPKSVLCIYFKKGNCQLGAEKCPCSHDWDVENQNQKKDMYTDTRDLSAIELGDMKDWDENTLRTILKKKEAGRPTNSSNQVCKHFIAAIEANKWGWFWECPNGNNTCVYKHALPPDYVLKKDKKKAQIETRSLEAVLEDERAKLTGTGTKVTPETFAAWKEKIRKQKEKETKKAAEQRQQQLKTGKVRMTGREVMESNAAKIQEEEEGDEDLDILQMLRAKKESETLIDEENATLAAELAREVEEELARDAKEGKVMKDPNAKEEKVNNTNTEAINEEKAKKENLAAPEVLTGVDVNLFQAEAAAEDLDVEFSDEV